MTTGSHRIAKDRLIQFCSEIFQCCGLSSEDAHVTSDVLVAADLRGIPSHGVARLWRYANGLETGQMSQKAQVKVLQETPATMAVSAKGAMGPPISVDVMHRLIDKAQNVGLAFATVRDSNHFGIAAYYAMLPLPTGMIGISMTNSAVLGVPTFGRKAMFGTNPIAFAAPALHERPFVLDMSTTTVTRGKIELYDRLGEILPHGWAVDKDGQVATDPSEVLHNLLYLLGGGLLPLGGEGENFSGYKGYGLGVMVDILCGVLTGMNFGPDIQDTELTSAQVGHFLGVIDISKFRDLESFRKDMDKMLRQLRETPAVDGHDRVLYAGLKEAENEDLYLKDGIPIDEKAFVQLGDLGHKYGIKLPELMS